MACPESFVWSTLDGGEHRGARPQVCGEGLGGYGVEGLGEDSADVLRADDVADPRRARGGRFGVRREAPVGLVLRRQPGTRWPSPSHGCPRPGWRDEGVHRPCPDRRGQRRQRRATSPGCSRPAPPPSSWSSTAVIGAITVRDELRPEARLTRASAGLVRAACG